MSLNIVIKPLFCLNDIVPVMRRVNLWIGFLSVFLLPSNAEAKDETRNLPVGIKIHVVDENAKTLSEIALLYYGKSSDYKKIAEWNGLQSPYKIRLRQKLLLKQSPKLSVTEGNAMLLQYWRKRFGLPDESKTLARIEAQQKVEAQKKEERRIEVKAKFEMAQQELESKKIEVIFEPTNAEALFQSGKKLFDDKNYEEALVQFRKSRESDEEFLGPWLFEMRTYRLLGHKEEEEKVKEVFLKRHPKLSVLPIFRAPASGGPPLK